MRIDILTLFPDMINACLHESILGRACKKGVIEINAVQIRDFTENRQRQVDDYPYGGGYGCVMMAQPLKSALDFVKNQGGDKLRRRVIYMSPQGRTLTQSIAREYAKEYDNLILVCGHYEGVDERFIEECVDEELSIGDFVLTGGEIAAMATADCVCRMMPGVLASEECYTGESHWEGLLEYPQYTRPEVWEGRAVPEVLQRGNHAEIEAWRRRKMLERTMTKRPDLFSAFVPNNSDAALIERIKKDARRPVIKEPVELRPCREEDVETVCLFFRQARNYFKKHGLDQWQDSYPNENSVREDMEKNRGYVITCAGKPEAYFCLSLEPEEYYSGLTDGKWRNDGAYSVIHRCCVSAEMRGSGLSNRIFLYAEELSVKAGVSSIRFDTHRKNKPMQALAARFGYTFRGNLILPNAGEGHDPRRQGFEKLIKGADEI